MIDSETDIALSRLISGAVPLDQFFPLSIGMAEAVADTCQNYSTQAQISPQSFLVNSSYTKIVMNPSCARSAAGIVGQYLDEDFLPYMAPEQSGRVARTPDKRSELYSLGIIYYEMLTGQRPFQAASALDWIHAHIARIPPEPAVRQAEIPRTLSNVVMKLLAKNPEDRYQSVDSLKHDLSFCFQHWQATGSIPVLPFSQLGHSGQLAAPQMLQGRDLEIQALSAALERTRSLDGTLEIVMISGFSGVGKTSLAHTVSAKVSPGSGLFIEGKFDQFQREVPYAGLIKALKNLCAQLLVLDEKELSCQGEKLKQALGPQCRILLELFPTLEPILADAPAIAELPPAEAERRQHQVMARFIGYFSNSKGPLILFLDDLQWADSSSLQFLNFLASYSPLQHVLLIGAYRENECLADQALSHLLEVFRELRPSSLTLSLKPLSIAAFTSLVADTLQMDPDHVSDLAALVFEKTGGNPYFCLQFLSSLHAESSLEFNFDKRAWQWDLVEIAGKSICSDLAELLARKLQGLQPDTQNFLSLAACWGSVFEPHKLAQFLDSTPEKIDSIVDEFLKQGLVCRRGETHQFAHDRIQEAAYALIPEPKRAALHLKIARVMQASSHDLFVTVGHYNHAAELLDGRERRQVALLNETAGQKAKAAAAFPAAAQYFAMARALLPSDIWAVEHELAFDLSFQEARCELASGHFEAGQLRLEHMNNEDLTLIERTRVSRLWIELFIGQGQMLNALDLGFQRLHQLGIQIPLHPASSEVDQEYQKFWDLLGSREIEEIVDLPLMTDLEKRETVALMAALVPPAFAVDFKLVAIIWCHLVNIVIEFGHCHTSVEAFGCFGLISQSLYDRFEEGYRFGKIAERLIDKHGFIAERVHSLGTLKHLAFWTRPISYALAYSEECNRAADEEGTNFLVCISRCHQVQFMLASGAPLETLIEKSEQITRFIQNRGFSTLALASSSLAFSLKSLSAGPPAAIMLNHEYLDEESFEARLDSFEITGIICFHYILKLSSHFISGEYAQAHAAGAKIRTRIWSVTSLPNLANYYFYYALTLAARHDTASEQERVQLTEELKVFAAKIETWAKSNPHTFMNKHALVGAEIARLEARDQEALKLYEQAGRLAREQGFVHEEALSYELTARFHASRGLNNFSLILIREARQAFERWGAQAKVMRLDRLYPELKSRLASVSQTSSSYHSSRIDLDSLLKSSRSISSELELKQLVQSLLEVVLVQAGADRAALAIMHDSELRLVASALMNSNAMDMDMSTDVSATSRPDILPAAVAHYVVRTQERVLLNAANRQAWFDLDATLKIQRPQSALCFPLTVQGQLIGLIYLENKTMSDVFTDDRIHILEVLAAQAAISIQHARLYQEVREQASRLHAILSSMADAVEVTGSDGHRLLSNEAFRQIFGNGEQLEIHASQSQVKTWQGETVAPSDLPRARAMRGEHVSHYGLRWINPVSGEEMFLQSSSTPVKDELDRNLGAVTVTRDLTEWVQLDKLKDEFLRVAAHELKTPVMIIKGYVQLLSRELQGIEGKKQTHLEAIESGTNRLSALTNALLDMSQAQLKRLRVNLEPLDLKALLLDCVHGIQVVSDRHKIRLLEVDPAVVLGSSMRLTQVLQNILGNAIKYSPDGGSVDVTMKVDSDWANVSVRDYGIGIPAAKQKQLFQMFFQAHIGTRHDFGGMGLGLYLVREIINLHHGDVWLTSEQGQGTTVSFRLPVARQV